MQLNPLLLALVALVHLVVLAPPAVAQDQTVLASFDEYDTDSLKELSIEALMDLEVTIASRSEESLSNLPGAVYVLPGDEIRRAGHSSIPEALRMVPGMYVSRWTGNAWDVTSRGFGPGLALNSEAYHNQLLVLINGVVVYTPLFPGTWWNLQDVDINDVDRIEIIRGPGGILWGSNATHGVVHVITKHSADTQGTRISLRSGVDDQHASARYGGTFGENGAYRVYGKGAWYDSLHSPFLNFEEDWSSISTGFRADWEEDGRQFNVTSRFYDVHQEAIGFDLTLFVPIPVTDEKKGYQIIGSVTDPEKNSRLQAWISTDQQAQPTDVDFTIDTFDIDYQRQFELSETNNLTVGGGYRRINSDMFGDDFFYQDYDPRKVNQDIFRVYALQKIDLPDIDSQVTLGLTAEHNTFTQFEIQPTARITWNPAVDVAVWAAISRAVRTPSLEERTLSANSYFVGNPDFKSESLVAYEAGGRALLSERVSMDVAMFFNDYDDLHVRAFDPGLFQFFTSNDGAGKAWGAEIAVDAKPTDRLTIRSGYTYSKGKFERRSDAADLGTERYHPEHQLNIRTYYDLGDNWELDAALYALENFGPGFKSVERMRADVRIGWRPSEELDFYVGVQHLNDDLYTEFSNSYSFVRRAVFVGMNWSPN